MRVLLSLSLQHEVYTKPVGSHTGMMGRKFLFQKNRQSPTQKEHRALGASLRLLNKITKCSKMRCSLNQKEQKEKTLKQRGYGKRIDTNSLIYRTKTKLLENIVKIGHTYSNRWQSKNNTNIKASMYRSAILVKIIVYKINKIILQNKTSQRRMLDFLLLFLNSRNKQFKLRKDLFQLWSKVSGSILRQNIMAEKGSSPHVIKTGRGQDW